MRSKRSLWFITMVLFLGAMLGTLLGQVIGLLLPDGVAKQFFFLGPKIGFDPVTLDLLLFSFTFGVKIKLNALGAIGIGVAVYLLRWVLN
ncbi:MAG: hypothetical protein ALAOOOJD_00854 [bacterium]|nr:hypothetical protein [bacterium]